MIIYLIGALVSAVVWFLLIKFRQGGYCIRMPDKKMGYLLEPMDDKEYVDYSSVMVVWFIMAFAWPVAWSFLLLAYLSALLIFVIDRVWHKTAGNEKFTNKVFGVKK